MTPRLPIISGVRPQWDTRWADCQDGEEVNQVNNDIIVRRAKSEEIKEFCASSGSAAYARTRCDLVMLLKTRNNEWEIYLWSFGRTRGLRETFSNSVSKYPIYVAFGRILDNLEEYEISLLDRPSAGH